MTISYDAWEARWVKQAGGIHHFGGVFDFMSEAGDISPEFSGYARLSNFNGAWELDYLVPLFGEWRKGVGSPTLEGGKKLFQELMAERGFELRPRMPKTLHGMLGLIAMPIVEQWTFMVPSATRHRTLL